MILLAFGALTLGESVYSFLPSWEWMIVTAPVAGFGFGMVEAAIGSLVIGFVHENKAVAMSRLEVFFGIGACVMPLIGSVLITLTMWKISFPILAVMSLGMLLLWTFTSFGSLDSLLAKQVTGEENEAISANNNKGQKAPSLYGRRGMPLLFIMLAFFVLYVGIEMSLVNFLPSILIEHSGTNNALATLSVSFFWIAMVIGRMFAGHLSEKWGSGRYLLINGFGSLLILAIIPLITGIAISYSLVLLLGLLMAGLFAIGLIFTNQIIPGTAERTTSLLIAAGGLGGALMPLLTGKLMDQYKSNISMWTLIGLMALMMVMLVIAIWYSKMSYSSTSTPRETGPSSI